MRVQHDTFRSLRKNLPIIAGLCLCLYFSYHTVSGDRSYSQLSSLKNAYEQKIIALNHLKNKKSDAQEKVHMMRPDSLSIDLVEEQARDILGYTKQGEFVIVSN
ncbi:MAG: FtsB family cell division protein [Alphaproteobacteria bacterium]